MSSQRSTPSYDELFRILADRRRRHVLYCLRRADDPVLDVDEVVERLIELHGDANDPPESLRREIVTSLHHVHLPDLSDANVVDYDWRSRTIRYREHDAVDEHLALCEERELRSDC